MTTVVIVAVVVVVAAGIAALVNGRRPDAPTAPRFAVPQQVDRADFKSSETPWLLALFTSATCLSCHDAREAVAAVRVDSVVVHDVAVEDAKPIHDRYGIDAVPCVVLADRAGVVRWSFLGAPPREAVRDALVDAGIIAPEDGTAVTLP